MAKAGGGAFELQSALVKLRQRRAMADADAAAVRQRAGVRGF